jgi:regulator of protease activity HflC (stomatin/prohibitin superfamily)
MISTTTRITRRSNLKFVGIGIAAVVGLLILSSFFGSFYTIDQGERGVLLRNGALSGVAEPGLGYKLPFIDSVISISIQTQAKTYDGGGAGLAVYSRDQQPAEVRVSVVYRADPSQVATLYERYGSLEGAVTRLVDPKVYEEFKTVFGQYNAITAVQDRARLNADTETAIRTAIGESSPILIESVQIENIDFSTAYEESIEARMLAEVEVQKLRQNAEREKVQAEIVVTQASAQADAVRAAAEAEAAAIRLRGDAEAQAINARGKALRENPDLIGLVQAEKWNGVLPTSMIPGSTVPFLNVNPNPSQQ